MAAEHAVLEAAKALQILHALVDFVAGEIALTAGAAKLQHEGQGLRVLRLRAVIGALGKIADHAGLHVPVTTEFQGPFQLEAELLEIMAMPGGEEILVAAAHGELEIADGSGLPLHEIAKVESAAAMREPALPFQRVALHDLHLASPSALRF